MTSAPVISLAPPVACSARGERRPRAVAATWVRWFPLFVALLAAAVTLGLWRALLAEEQRAHAQTTAAQLDSVSNEIAVRMESRLLALERMGRRWALHDEPAAAARWSADARLYVEHYPGYAAIALLDGTGRIERIVPEAAAALAGTIEARARACAGPDATGGAQPALAATPTFAIQGGLRVFQVGVPVRGGPGRSGCIVGVFRTSELVGSMIGPHIAPGYGIEVREREQLVYRRAPARSTAPAATLRDDVLELHGLRWRVAVWPAPDLVAAMSSPLPLAVLAGGLMQALLIGVAVYLAQLARMRARELEAADRDLRTELDERMRTQETLRKLSLAVEQSPTMVMITGADGAIEYVNPKFTEVTGYALEEVRDRNPRILKSGATPAHTYADLWATLLAGRQWRGELTDRKKSGQLFVVQTGISPIRDGDGSISHFLAEMEDVTERRQMEREIEEQNRKMAEHAALAAMGQAASMIAHDLRNPLSSIKMALQILGRYPRPPRCADSRELPRIALEQVHYMEEVLTDLLCYARPDALAPAWLDVNRLIDRAIDLVQRDIEASAACVRRAGGARLPRVHGDANKLQQAFSNLLANAIQASEDLPDRCAEVTIAVSRRRNASADEVQIEIRDNGHGVVPELRGQVFEPFFTTRARGTGLGLPIARRIIEQHRGSLVLEPACGGGTCARVRLPATPLPPAVDS